MVADPTNQMFEAINEANSVIDQTESVSSERVLPPAGLTFGRLVTYVEIGKKEFTFQGKSTGVADACRIGFELLHPKKNIQEDGSGQFISFPTPIKMSPSKKSRFYKLLMDMRYGREDIKNMFQMIGEAFAITIEHTPDGKYANIVNVGKPYLMNVETGDMQVINVLPCTRAYQLFIWRVPNKVCWDSLFIDGEYTDENGITHSKNRLQNEILQAKNFAGSPVETMLAGMNFETSSMDDVPF